MTTTTPLASALHALQDAVETPRRSGTSVGTWRWRVRQRLGSVRDALMSESSSAQDAWLAARGGVTLKERNGLLIRISTLAQQVLEAPDLERVRHDLRRLIVDVNHHAQRIRDLAYDDVELELGGSE
ncbi:hypothetical protein [Nocardioides insulae]|uniref:hypothetical protein n=1 Tax=Nocardioides insulae TaxID=394734 RepID=UPI00041645D8|nr:hypothetical protein [Nocardioides insulae]